VAAASVGARGEQRDVLELGEEQRVVRRSVTQRGRRATRDRDGGGGWPWKSHWRVPSLGYG